MHEGTGVQGVHETQGMSYFVSCHVDQVCKPNAWERKGKPLSLGVRCVSCSGVKLEEYFSTRAAWSSPSQFCRLFPILVNPGTKAKLQAPPAASVCSKTCVTFFPAEPGVPQYPVLMVIKMDFPVGGEEGVGKFPGCSIKAVVNERLQTVRVIDGVEACEKKQQI